MDPGKTSSLPTRANLFIHQVVIQAAKSASTGTIQQLSATQREILLKIINNTDNVFTNYELGLNTELDRHLKEIDIVLKGGSTPREEGIGANFMRAVKSGVGKRASSETVNRALLDPNAVYRKHIYLDFESLLPEELFTPEIRKQLHELPDRTKELINNLMGQYLDLAKKQIPATTPLTDPVYTPFLQAWTELQSEYPVSEKKPKPEEEMLKGFLLYINSSMIPNSQRPHLGFSKELKGQHDRLEKNLDYHMIHTTAGSLERMWTEEGFVQPARGLNLWEKFTIIPEKEDQFTFQLESRSNVGGKEKSRTREIKLDLRPYRPDPLTPLTEKQRTELLHFLSYDSILTLARVKEMGYFDELTFLSPEQQKSLLDFHNDFCNLVVESLAYLYQRP